MSLFPRHKTLEKFIPHSTTATKTLTLTLSLLLHGCGFTGSNEDAEHLEASVSIVGNIEGASENASPIVIALSSVVNGQLSLEAHTVVYGDSDFSLSARAGKYYLLAFEDSNHDFAIQQNERIGLHGNPTELSTAPGKKYTDVLIQLKNSGDVKTVFPSLLSSEKPQESVNIDGVQLGKIVAPSLFQQENGPLGVWNPIDFHRLGHSGIYFLEPFDSNKIPVLFVHGMSGSGHDWLHLLNQLDRDRFQPWVAQYPSGVSISLISQSLSKSINQLSATYNVQNIAIVAHSMGGLVSRGLIHDQLANTASNIAINPLITISTPWLGHKAASFGAKYAPVSVAVSSWFDIAPGSHYLTALHASAMPEHLEHHLLFSYDGKGGGMLKKANSDGTVTLASQLPLKLQEKAIRVTGYNEDHVSILSSTLVAQNIEEILKESFSREN